MNRLSFSRWFGIVLKEFIQLRRDRLTFGMIIGIPIVQLLLFGFAINVDPKNLPTAVVDLSQTEFSRSFLAGMENTRYFKIDKTLSDGARAGAALARGDVQFIVTIPSTFARSLLRGERPALLVQADATDPAATSNALVTINPSISTTILRSAAASIAPAIIAISNPPKVVRMSSGSVTRA